ncbi:MAG: hypothetical protein ACP5NK_04215 [Thermoplasmata archaeon]
MSGKAEEIEKRCIFNVDGKCGFVESYLTPCVLCFNFSTPYPPENSSRKTSTKSLYYLNDYMESNKTYEITIPTGRNVQATLKLD